MAELTTLARPYAKAVFAFALANNDLENWSTMLATLSDIIKQEKVQQALSSPALTSEKQVAIVAEIYGEQLSEKGQNFISLLAENKRLLLLPMIVEQFEILKAKQEQLSRVNIKSAYALNTDVEQKLANALEKKLNCRVEVESAVDETLIGGVVIRTGDLVIDNSVRGRLAKLTESVKS